MYVNLSNDLNRRHECDRQTDNRQQMTNKKFELMLTRCAKAYSSSGSVY